MASSCGEPVLDHADRDLVRHEVAGVHELLRLEAQPVPSLTLARKMSPVEIFGTAKCDAMNCAWVPLPAPGGPTSTSRIYRRKPS